MAVFFDLFLAPQFLNFSPPKLTLQAQSSLIPAAPWTSHYILFSFGMTLIYSSSFLSLLSAKWRTFRNPNLPAFLFSTGSSP